MPCTICDILGLEQRADHDEGEHLPAEFHRLITVDEDPYTIEVMRCPECGTYYYHEYKVDNDIYNSIHVSTLRRVSADAACELMRVRAGYDRKARKTFLRKVSKKFGPMGKGLTEDETRVLDHLIRRSPNGGGNHPKAMEEGLGMSPGELEAVFKRLEELKVIVRNVSLPAGAEPGLDVRDYTHVKINPDV